MSDKPKKKTVADYPELVAQWHPTKNGDLRPEDVSDGTNAKVWWLCPVADDHEWHARIYSRTSLGTGCACCAGRKVSRTNSLATRWPKIATEWHPEKNGDLQPEDVVAGSSQKVWWKCPVADDHEWHAPVSNRTSNGRGCPACSGKQVSKTNSLLIQFPAIAAQFHPTKNSTLDVASFVAGSNKKVWWKCHKGPDHEWQATISGRTSRKTGCPACAGQQVSVTNSLLTLHPNLAAEWHPTKNGDITPSEVTAGSTRKVWWKCPKGPDHEWQISPGRRTGRGSGCPACAGRQVSVTNSVATAFPDLAAQWHPTKNGDLTPDEVVAGSNKKVWWKCPVAADHEWLISPNNRTSRGSGCPCCSGRQVSTTNSLSSLFPEIATQWHPTKNGNLKSDAVTAGSDTKIWWKCREGPDHEWEASCNNRTNARTGGSGCPFCSGSALSITNSLATLYPEIAAQWHPTKNGDLTPANIVAGSGDIAWWLCAVAPDHVWRARIAGRTSKNSGCPACAGRQVSVTNSLASLQPKIAAEWHPTKNGNLQPSDVAAGTASKYWWKCPVADDHEWVTSPAHRVAGKTGCPACAGQQLSTTNSLATHSPDIAAEWHPTKNGSLTPADVVNGTHKKVWWRCRDNPNHVWDANIVDRTRRGDGCPYCSSHRVDNNNNLTVTHPTIAAEWHPTKNGDRRPQDVAAGSGFRVWWKCPEGPDHEWRTRILERAVNGHNCPACANLQLSVTNALSKIRPDIAKQWHPTKNGNLSPEDVVAGGNKRAWWLCPVALDHEWQTTIGQRVSQNSGCPACANQQVSTTNSLATKFPDIAAQLHPTKNGGIDPKQIISGSNHSYIWRCPVNTDHEWETTVNKRVHEKTGCPYCDIAPRSKQEIRLAFELAHHIPIDHEFHKIKTAMRLWDVDICAPDLKLVIEFDGSYFHAEKAEKDRTKARNLRRNGWRVVRVREAPLKKLSKWNVVIPTNADAHEAALLVLEHLENVLDMDIPRMDERRAADGPLCADAAEAYIEKLLLEKQAKEEQDG